MEQNQKEITQIKSGSESSTGLFLGPLTNALGLTSYMKTGADGTMYRLREALVFNFFY